ncbi:MAG: hypothetical protein DRP66_06105, partial [Planctomycetota bacterium]
PTSPIARRQVQTHQNQTYLQSSLAAADEAMSAPRQPKEAYRTEYAMKNNTFLLPARNTTALFLDGHSEWIAVEDNLPRLWRPK